MRLRHAVLGITAGIVALLGAWVSAPSAHADVWDVGPDFVSATLDAGYAPDGTAYSGSVSVHMQFAVVSGQFKIDTTIVSVAPQPGFTYKVKKSGGLDSAVEIEFTSATCQSVFKFLYKPGLTKIDSGGMRCK